MVTVLDHFTKYAFAFPVRSHDAITIAKYLVERVFLVYGLPNQLLSDRGAEFEGSVMTEVCRLLEIDKIRTTSYKPSTNGALERVHRTLNTMLGKIVSENQRDWDGNVVYVLAAFNGTEHGATGYTPNMMVYGREMRFPNELMYTDVGDDETMTTSSVEFVAERQLLFRKAFTLARDTLGIAAERSKKRYDMRVKPISNKVGDWVYYFCPRHRVGRSPKWQRFYSGPYLVTEILGTVNLRLQKSVKANKMFVHVDKFKHCTGNTPVSWLGTDHYIVIPPVLGSDVLPHMFGNVDRTGPLASTDDTNPTVIVRPKRNAGMPSRFLCRIYALYDNEHICVCTMEQGGGGNNDDFCLSRYHVIKKAATKKMDFEYRCFPCLKQDDKARSYTRSYDLMLHMVNTHGKFPVDARHNAYYAADGSDLRDATKEEIKKYRLAALHKRKKPDADPTWGKGGSSASTTRGDRRARESSPQHGVKRHSTNSSRDRGKDRGSRNREAEVKDKRDSSRDTRKGNETSSTEGRKNDARKDEGARHKDASSTERCNKKDKKPARIRKNKELSTERGGTDTKKGENRSDQPGSGEVDKDERDRRNVEEIQRRMEARKAARESERARAAQTEVIPSLAIHAAVVAVKPPVIITDKSVEGTATATRRASGKAGRTTGDALSADAGQREQAKQWAEDDTSTTSTVTQSTVEKGSTRSKAVSKKSSERHQTTSTEDKRNFYAQDFIASQYPSVEEV